MLSLILIFSSTVYQYPVQSLAYDAHHAVWFVDASTHLTYGCGVRNTTAFLTAHPNQVVVESTGCSSDTIARRGFDP